MLAAPATRLLDDTTTGCWVTYEPRFLCQGEADALFATLLAEAPFVAEAPLLFGRPRPVKRQSCAFGEPGTSYRYSGLLRRARPWPALLVPLVDRLRRHTATPLSFALCNLYSDGEAGLGWHADDEADLVAGATIASISLGESRDFALRRGDRGPSLVTLALEHGSLLLMGGQTQRYYQHRVPERRRCQRPRINLTFRQMAEPRR